MDQKKIWRNAVNLHLDDLDGYESKKIKKFACPLTVEEFLNCTKQFNKSYKNVGLFDSTFMPNIRHKAICGNGFEVSIQATAGMRCNPQDNKGPWTSVELGYPSQDMWDDFLKHAELPQQPRETVYSYVPINLVEQYITYCKGIIGYYELPY